jgi:hypothetical protein
MTKVLNFFITPPTLYCSLNLLILTDNPVDEFQGIYIPLHLFDFHFFMRHKLILLAGIFLFPLQFVSAQYYETGQDPSSLKWKQIKTGNFTVIYPEQYGNEGIEYAKALDEAYVKMGYLFPQKKLKIPVIIHSYTVQSNGYVAWAPKRIELYPTPEQNTVPLAPEKQLAIHEMTHVIQMKYLTEGFSGCMSVIFGQQFAGVVSALLPLWLFEGDAVYAESVLTESGRGRSPAFQKQLKAIVVDRDKRYKYDKILNGSYRNFIPDHYETGYQMVTMAIAKKYPYIWNQVFHFTGHAPFTLNPVNFSLRKSDLRKKTLWNETSDSLKILWNSDITEHKAQNYSAVNPDKKKNYINYYSPVFVSRDSIIAVKTSLKNPASFVLINPKLRTEKRLYTPGQLYPWFISYGNGKLVWVETVTDARWENREYSIIKIMDVATGKVHRLSRKSRYLSAAISPDGRTIVATENDIKNRNTIVLMNIRNANITDELQTPGNAHLQHPQWSTDGKEITFISLTDAGEGIISFIPGQNKWKTLADPGRDDLQSAFIRNDSLYFISSSSGTDNIYLKTPDEKKISLLTSSKFGTIDAVAGGNSIYFGNYTFYGNDISSIPIKQAGTEKKEYTSSPLLIKGIEIKQDLKQDTIQKSYSPIPYRKIGHLFTFHSWMPFYADIDKIQSDPTSVRPGFTIMSQNSLSTLITTLAYEYSEEKRNVFHSKIAWKGWYPVIESEVNYGGSPTVQKMGGNIQDPAGNAQAVHLINTISVPLLFNSGKFSQYLRPSVSADFENNYIFTDETGTYDYGQNLITSRLYFSNYHRSAVRDIYPRWAQIVDFNYMSAPFDKQIYGSSTALQTAFYFPGFIRNNGIKIRAEFEVQVNDQFLFGNFSSLPRGYKDIISKDYRFLSADYVMPLLYPDFNLASLLYIKRIRTDFFYDYAQGPENMFYQKTATGYYQFGNSSATVRLKSFGFELLADFFVLRVPYMISGGIRATWKNTNELPLIEALFNIDLFGLSLGKSKL